MANYLDHVPQQLLNDIVRSRSLPIIGAGFSANAELPGSKTMPLWDQLGQHFAAQIPGQYPFTTPVDALSSFAHQFGRTKLIEELYSQLHVDDSKPREAQAGFVQLPFDYVITTNYDSLLERAYSQVGRSCLPLVDESQLSLNLGEISTRIVKLHGDFQHPANLVVTEDDYDSFIDKYPLLSTFISNLLISRTPIFIGYSLNDPDFRQLWQLIVNRLGKLRRPAYAIQVGPDPVGMLRFQRRNVTVISLPGGQQNRGKILAALFQQIKGYWDEVFSRESQVTTEEALSELSLPHDTRTRLCFFAMPARMQAYYKTHYFPSLERFGFTPVSWTDVITPGENLVSAISTLVERSALVAADLTSESAALEATLAVAKGRTMLLITEQGSRIPNALSVFRRVTRPPFPTPPTPQELDEFEAVVKQLSTELLSGLQEEPMRLLQADAPRAAIISAFSLLEATLRERLSSAFPEGKRVPPIREVLDKAMSIRLIPAEDRDRLSSWLSIRSKALHTGEPVNLDEAREIVRNVLALQLRIKASNP